MNHPASTVSKSPGSSQQATPRTVHTPTSRCRFGLAWGDITPPVGIYHRMWGAALHDRAEGIHQPLRASVLVLESLADASPDPPHVIVALDHCLFGPVETAALQQAIAARTGIDVSQILVVFSHTHAAGLMMLDRVDQPGGDLIPSYLRQIQETSVHLTERALATKSPVTVTYGMGRCGLAVHRDQWDEVSQQWVCGFQPEKPADDGLLVARIVDDAGRLRGTLVHYACHPTTLAWENRLVSPDFVGTLRDVVERETGAPCVFLQGASGDLGPRDGFVGDVAVAERNGRQLAYAALATLTALPPPETQFEYCGPVVSGATLGVWRHRPMDEAACRRAAGWSRESQPLHLPYRADLPQRLIVCQEREDWVRQEDAVRRTADAERIRECRAQVERRTRLLTRLEQLPPGEYPYPLQVWRVGEAAWVAAQGEPYSSLQTTLRARFPHLAVVVCGLANGWGPSYLPPAELFGQGQYQESIAVLAPDSLSKIIEEATNRIRKLFP